MNISEQMHLPLRMSTQRFDTIVNSFGINVAECTSVDYVAPLVRCANSFDMLLAALKLAEKHIDHVCGETTEEDLPDWFADLKTISAAIAWAEGRTDG